MRLRNLRIDQLNERNKPKELNEPKRPDEEGIIGFVGFIELTGFVALWVCGTHEEVCGQRR